MKWTILSRLVIGYLVIFLLVIVMNLYTIVRIGQLNEGTQSLLITNYRVMDDVGKLTDTLLSQMGTEKKFLITRDEAFLNQFQHLRSDWDRTLEETRFRAEDPEIRGILKSVHDLYGRYQSLFQEEVPYARKKLGYAVQKYKEEKEETTNLILEELDRMKSHLQERSYDRMKELYEAGDKFREMAMVMTGGFLGIGLIISFFLSRSITRPVALLKKKTREIAKGNFEGDLSLSSPPEMRDLASAFNLMCHKLQELDKMKSDFFSSMSHELRTPLSTIKMGIGLLEDGTEGPLTEEQRRLLDILNEETSRLIGQVNSLLDLSKMEAGMMTYHFEPGGLAPLITQAVQEISPLVASKKIHLETNLLDTLPNLNMDSERVLQALRNLIGNAVKFTPNGGRVEISARSVRDGVQVSVADTGPGISAEHLTAVFEKFTQITPKGSEPVKGTGLGLAMAKQIVTQHGGRIWAESQPGHGSTFTFVLPA